MLLFMSIANPLYGMLYVPAQAYSPRSLLLYWMLRTTLRYIIIEKTDLDSEPPTSSAA